MFVVGERDIKPLISTPDEFNHRQLRLHRKISCSRPPKIEKVMRACDSYLHYLSFLQRQIEIFETGITLDFPHISRNVFLS